MSTGSARRQVLLSAHRGGCGRSPLVENTLAAFEAVLRTPVEYVEFDVQRTADGVFLLNHEDRVWLGDQWGFISEMTAVEVDALLGVRVRYAEVLSLLAAAERKAHLDFKFVSPDALYAAPEQTYEVAAVEMARTYLPDTDFIVTSAEDRTVRAVRDWSDLHGVEVMVGLSIGRHRLTGMRLWQQVLWRVGEMFPEGRIQRSGANLVVAQRHLARVRLLAWAHRNDLPVLVWTVDNHKELARLLVDKRVWMVTSNFPERGLTLRERLSGLSQPITLP
jgi:glycerophosphoryl diester phosphodiesterase